MHTHKITWVCKECHSKDVEFKVDDHGNAYKQCRNCGHNNKPPEYNPPKWVQKV